MYNPYVLSIHDITAATTITRTTIVIIDIIIRVVVVVKFEGRL